MRITRLLVLSLAVFSSSGAFAQSTGHVFINGSSSAEATATGNYAETWTNGSVSGHATLSIPGSNVSGEFESGFSSEASRYGGYGSVGSWGHADGHLEENVSSDVGYQSYGANTAQSAGAGAFGEYSTPETWNYGELSGRAELEYDNGRVVSNANAGDSAGDWGQTSYSDGTAHISGEVDPVTTFTGPASSQGMPFSSATMGGAGSLPFSSVRQ